MGEVAGYHYNCEPEKSITCLVLISPRSSSSFRNRRQHSQAAGEPLLPHHDSLVTACLSVCSLRRKLVTRLAQRPFSSYNTGTAGVAGRSRQPSNRRVSHRFSTDVYVCVSIFITLKILLHCARSPTAITLSGVV